MDPKFIVDTGSELRLMKENSLGRNARVNKGNIYGLSGISDGLVETKGQVVIVFNNDYTCKLNIIPDSFPIPHDGILGADFLRGNGAVVSFRDESVVMDEDLRDAIPL